MRKSKTMFAFRCVWCDEHLGASRLALADMKEAGYSDLEALNALGIRRRCCREAFLGDKFPMREQTPPTTPKGRAALDQRRLVVVEQKSLDFVVGTNGRYDILRIKEHSKNFQVTGEMDMECASWMLETLRKEAGVERTKSAYWNSSSWGWMSAKRDSNDRGEFLRILWAEGVEKLKPRFFYFPGGDLGEGWNMIADAVAGMLPRQVTKRNHSLNAEPIPMSGDLRQVIETKRYGSWTRVVVVSLDRLGLSWVKVGAWMQESFHLSGECELNPFDSQQTFFMVSEEKLVDRFCSGKKGFVDGVNISLSKWSPEANGLRMAN